MAGPERDEEPSGKSPPPDSDPFSAAEFGKIWAGWSREFCRAISYINLCSTRNNWPRTATRTSAFRGALVYRQTEPRVVRSSGRILGDEFCRSAENSALYSNLRRARRLRPTNSFYACSLLKCFQVFEQFLFVPVRQLGAVNVTLVAVPFFSRVEKKIRLR